MQVFCEHNESEMHDRKIINIYLCGQVALSAIVFIILIAYFKNRTKQQYKTWDMSTKTIADYTLHLKIDHDFYENYKTKIFP